MGLPSKSFQVDKRNTILDTQGSVIWQVRANKDSEAVTDDTRIWRISVNFPLL